MRHDELAHFLEVARTQNVTKAAEALRMTQPALSRSIARLEQELGVPLFDREGRRVRLNQNGEVLVPHAARVLAELSDARARIDALREPTAGVVSIAYVTSFGSWLVPALVEAYRAIVPQTRFLLSGGPADGVIDAVRDGSADIGFLAPRPASVDLRWTELAQEALVLAVSLTHTLARAASVSPDDLAPLDIVALRPEFGLRQITDDYFAKCGIAPNIVMQATEISTLWPLVAAGLGAAVMPQYQHPHPGIVQVPLAQPVSRPAGMIVSGGVSLAPAAAQFARFVGEEAATLLAR